MSVILFVRTTVKLCVISLLHFVFLLAVCGAGGRQGHGVSPPGRDGDGRQLRRRTVVAATSKGNSLRCFAVEVVVVKFPLGIVVVWVAKGPPYVWRCRYEREQRPL